VGSAYFSALDELIVAPDAAVGSEHQELESDSRHFAVLGDHLPVELDDVGEPLDVVSSPEAELPESDELFVGARRSSILLVSVSWRWLVLVQDTLTQGRRQVHHSRVMHWALPAR
jgi:hypothetical protein